ncbi:MAG: glycosyl hydrolase 115 family protein [Bacteroidales bacterium]|nr:glycosyl hydrolase 115 family protein [Bacteroidales bacterium]
MRTLLLLAFLWFGGQGPLTYTVSRNADPVVGVAVEMLQDDLQEVTGTRPQPTRTGAGLRIVQYDRERTSLARLGVPAAIADSLRFVREAFYVGTAGGQLVVVGSDARGTAYGVLELSRLAGVSPWTWWGDSRPEKRERLEIPEGYSSFQHPSVEYRGLFLNDEDWAFRVWSAEHFSPQGDRLTISADTYREICKLLLRLRGNTLWPGMHPGTTAFFQVPGARQMADSLGILIGSSHCEPLLRNNVGEWNESERGRYNYLTNKQKVLEYWTERLQEVDRDNLFTIGMRGIHDGSMEGLERATLDEKTAALQQVIDDQRALLRKYIDKDLTKIPQMFMPYKEVLEIMENGLQVPDDVTIVWCDDNYGYMTRLPDAEQQRRSGGSGVYYHLSYCGRPHDCLWLSTVQPGLIYHEMMEAYRHNVRKLWIANVHDPKVAAYDLEFFLDLAWDINCVQPETVQSHQERWLAREYGPEAADRIAPAMLEFYRLCGMRRPEFMGWSQVELPDRERYPSGLSPVRDTDFSFSEFQNEAQRYIDRFRSVRRRIGAAAASVPERQRDAWFAAVAYPVYAAESHAEKLLYAQRARERNKTTYSPGPWQTDSTMLAAAALSQRAYQDVRSLTRYYNGEMAGGRWRGAMSERPRDLYVFWAPQLPVTLTEEEAAAWSRCGEDWQAPEIPAAGTDYFAADACDFREADTPVRPVQGLGHSGRAVPVPKGASLHYDFRTERSGEAVLRVAVIPTQANDRGDIRFSVSVDGGAAQVWSIKEPYRSDRWKENVMRGQAVATFPVTLTAGAHTLKLTALDDHILFDQWMVDFQPERKFYLFPL